ncbi:MAG: hypothetical protein H0W84_14125 [Bacteroidetes bacterium]|nr:hypothetical protein [Bacteroidota bacterium]
MKMRNQLLFCIFFLFYNFSLLAQNQNEEERKEQFLADSTKIYVPKPVRPQFKFDTRTTVYEGQKINSYGYDAGIMVKNKLRLTLGYYRMNDNLPKEQLIKDVKTKQHLRVYMGTANLELNYLRKRFFSLGFPLEIGVGEYLLKNFSTDSIIYEISHIKGYVVFSNFGLSGTFTPIRWLGLKGMVGYRKAVIATHTDFDFNGVFTSIALSVDIQEIIKDIKMYRLKKRYYGKSFKKFVGFTDIIAD